MIGLLDFFFTSSYSYLAGVVLLIIGVAATVAYSYKAGKIISLSLIGSGLLLMLFSGVFPGVFFRFIVIMTLGLFLSLQVFHKLLPPLLYFLRGVVIISACIAFGIEWKAMSFAPEIGSFDRIYVIGGALSSGSESSDEPVWPRILSEKLGGGVVNLSSPGLSASAAEEMISEISGKKSLVILDLGAYELDKGISPVQFKADLNALVAALVKKRYSVMIIELPVSPLNVQYLEVQRQAASRYGAVTVPRKIISALLADSETSFEGARLNSKGHRILAELLASRIRKNKQEKE